MNDATELERGMKGMKAGDCCASLAGGPGSDAVFLVRERSAVIKYFGETEVEVRAALFPFDGPAIVAVAFRLGRTVPIVYPVLLNFQRDENARILRVLARQAYLPVYFFGDNGRKDRTFITLNHLQEFFRETVAVLDSLPPWSEEDYLAAASRLKGRCPTAYGLWEAMVD